MTIKEPNPEDYIISNKQDCKIIVKEEEVIGKNNLIIENIKNCTIIALFSFKACYLKNISSSLFYIGSVGGGSHITNINNCEVNLATHQLRIHEAIKTNFNVIVMSNPIIEHCSDLNFKKLNIVYDIMQKIFDVTYHLKFIELRNKNREKQMESSSRLSMA